MSAHNSSESHRLDLRGFLVLRRDGLQSESDIVTFRYCDKFIFVTTLTNYFPKDTLKLSDIVIR